jgi:hypothetical protein
MFSHPRFVAAGFAVALFALANGVESQQANTRRDAPAGPLKSELSLQGQTARVTIEPDLRADAPPHRGFFSASDAPARVRIGSLETTGSLRFGDLTIGKTDPRGIRYDLWASGTAGSWSLEAAEAPKEGSDTPAGAVSSIPLVRRDGAEPSPVLVASLVPETGRAARLVVRWGDVEAAADLEFVDPAPRRPRGRASEPVNRKHDEDTSLLSRALMLAQRNETALVTPGGARISIHFARSFPRGERSATAAAAGVANTPGLGVDGPDFAKLMSTPDGAVVVLSEAAVPRLTIEAPVQFGDARLRTGNQGPGYPGAYGMWLKRAGTGWRLVFSDEPDTWGSQHDPKFDTAEIALDYSSGHDPSRPFTVGLVPAAPDSGRLRIFWGPHEWTTNYSIVH